MKLLYPSRDAASKISRNIVMLEPALSEQKTLLQPIVGTKRHMFK